MPVALIVAASPQDQGRLRLNAECRDIKKALKRSTNRECWTIESNEAATVDDLRLALLEFRPTIVHFAGHGGGPGGLCFEDSDGNTHSTDAEPLAKLFHHFKENLKCVVLNACYSDEQGELIRQEIDYVVGMRAAIEDDAAMAFAVAFYDAVFAGTDFRTAFDLGCTTLDLNKLPDSDVPLFMTSPHLEGTTLAYSAVVPVVERVLHAYVNTPFAKRCPFTTTGDPLLPLIKRHYGEQMLRQASKLQIISMESINDEQWRVHTKLGDGDEQSKIQFYVRIRNRTVLVEWEATVGLWSVPVKTFLALGSAEPVVARVRAEIDDSYFGRFSDAQHTFQAVFLCTLAGETLHGYVERNTQEFDELIAILLDGNSHELTIEIVSLSDRPDLPIISKLLSPSWLYMPNDGT